MVTPRLSLRIRQALNTWLATMVLLPPSRSKREARKRSSQVSRIASSLLLLETESRSIISAINCAYCVSSSVGEARRKRSKRERKARCSERLKFFPFQSKLPFSKSIESLLGSKTRLAISRKVLVSNMPPVGADALALAGCGIGVPLPVEKPIVGMPCAEVKEVKAAKATMPGLILL